mgnify:CR=1 FL=1
MYIIKLIEKLIENGIVSKPVMKKFMFVGGASRELRMYDTKLDFDSTPFSFNRYSEIIGDKDNSIILFNDKASICYVFNSKTVTNYVKTGKAPILTGQTKV